VLGPDGNGKLLVLSRSIGQVRQAVQLHRSRFERRRVGSEDLPKLVEVGLLGDKRESEHLFEGGDLTPEVGVRFLELLDARRGIGVRFSRHRRFNCTKLVEHRSCRASTSSEAITFVGRRPRMAGRRSTRTVWSCQPRHLGRCWLTGRLSTSGA